MKIGAKAKLIIQQLRNPILLILIILSALQSITHVYSFINYL